jgi:archaemetzincin|uniref:Zinc metallopeptidase n=1 Tax=Desulfomonile tiedjei TaxID=2358 RepID=A0A7C4EVG0_9BACT
MNVAANRSDHGPAKEGLIAVIPLGRVGEDVLRVVADSLQGILRLPVDLLEPEPLPPEAFMELRNQYNAMTIIKHLSNNRPGKTMKILGVTTKDLCNPILTYVFGEAYMNGAAAVLSCYRLHRGRESEFAPREVFLERVVKVALHEIGHTFNLPHCHSGRCVMRASNTLAELDDKLNYLCDYCEMFLSEAVRDMLEREKGGAPQDAS